MDKYIKILLIQLSSKYKISLITVMTNDKKKINSFYKLVIKGKRGKNKDKLLLSKDYYSKRDIVSELLKWEEKG